MGCWMGLDDHVPPPLEFLLEKSSHRINRPESTSMTASCGRAIVVPDSAMMLVSCSFVFAELAER
jgi:hypothetical protein